MRIILLVASLFLAFNSVASANTDQLQKQFPTEYSEMKKSCGEWADEDGLNGADRNRFVDNCIEEEIGYLLDGDEESLSDEGESDSESKD